MAEPAEPVAPRAPAGRRRLAGLGLALWLLVTLRVGLELVGIASLRLYPVVTLNGDWTELWVRDAATGSEWITLWQRWDALWYQKIAEDWYRAGDNTIHFVPLYPLLGRLVAPLVGGSVPVALLVVASLAYVLAMWLLYRVARLDVGPVAARLTVLLVAFHPVGFFLLAPYTESLYLALTLAAFWLARRGHPWAAGLLGFAAGATRTVGAFLVVPLAYEYLRQRSDRGERPGAGLLAATLPGWGLVAATAYMRLAADERRSVLEVADRWGDRLSTPWDALSASWAFIARTGGDPPELLNLASLLGFSLLVLFVLRRLPLAYGLYAGSYMLLLLCRQSGASPVESVGRYTLVLFPCFIVLALWLSRRRLLAASWLVVGLLLQAFFMVHFVHFGFVG